MDKIPMDKVDLRKLPDDLSPVEMDLCDLIDQLEDPEIPTTLEAIREINRKINKGELTWKQRVRAHQKLRPEIGDLATIPRGENVLIENHFEPRTVRCTEFSDFLLNIEPVDYM